MDAAAGIANSKVLRYPIKAGAVVRSGNEVGIDVADFNSRLGIQEDRDALEAKRWGEAVGEARVAVVHTAQTGVAATARFGSEAIATVKSVASGVSANIAEHLPRKRDEDPDGAKRD